jgi:hypothetical protein
VPHLRSIHLWIQSHWITRVLHQDPCWVSSSTLASQVALTEGIRIKLRWCREARCVVDTIDIDACSPDCKQMLVYA